MARGSASPGTSGGVIKRAQPQVGYWGWGDGGVGARDFYGFRDAFSAAATVVLKNCGGKKASYIHTSRKRIALY